MTRVDFYTHTPDKLDLARILTGKAYQQGLKVMLYSPDSRVVADMDKRLWETPSNSFLPHCACTASYAATTPVVLGETADHLPHDNVLINLHDSTPTFFSRFERLIEIVSLDGADQDAARLRWRFYKQRGYEMRNHDLREKQI
ncbi:MAG: DNA polymerase III subunit chi [Sulfuriferula sp.]